MTKIALFMLPPLTQGGGAEKYFIQLASKLSSSKTKIDIITLDDKFFRVFARILHIIVKGNAFGYINFDGTEKADVIRQSLKSARWLQVPITQLGKTLRTYDVIYTKNEIVDLVCLKLFRRLPPVIIGVHTPFYFPITKTLWTRLHNFFYSSVIYRFLISNARTFHVSNQFSQEFCHKKLDKPSSLIYYPFSVSEFRHRAGKTLSPFSFDSGLINLAYISRLSEQKGTDLLIRLLKKLTHHPSLTSKIAVHIFGSGDPLYQQKLTNLSKQYDFIHYHSHVENRFIPHILSQTDLLIAPSRWDVLPFNILEAQAMGVPVLALNVPGAQDIIKDGHTGFLVPGYHKFYSRLKSYLRHPVSFNSRRISTHIQKKFDPGLIYNQLKKLLISHAKQQ